MITSTCLCKDGGGRESLDGNDSSMTFEEGYLDQVHLSGTKSSRDDCVAGAVVQWCRTLDVGPVRGRTQAPPPAFGFTLTC